MKLIKVISILEYDDGQCRVMQILAKNKQLLSRTGFMSIKDALDHIAVIKGIQVVTDDTEKIHLEIAK